MLKISKARKTFGDLVAVDDLTLEIETGEIFGLLGPNGAGKTTTVSMAVGLLDPDSGHVKIGDFGSPKVPSARNRIGVAPQTLAIYEELSGEENLRFFGKLQGLYDAKLRERVDWALEFVDLNDRRKDAVKTYSGGMQRRLNLAVAIVHRPPLLLLDEPTVGVDPQSRNAIFEKIYELREGGCTIVYTTHYMEEAERLCDRVGIIDRGRLLDLDTVDALTARHGGASLVSAVKEDGEELKIETEDPLTEMKRLLEGGELRSFSVNRPNLEAVFLNLTGRQLRD